jgi:hypothetical protein
MATFVSRTLPLLIAAGLAVPTAVIAQEPEQRVTVFGAMQEPEQRVTVFGAMQEPEQRVTVFGAMQESEQRVTVFGASADRSAPAAEDPADKAIPALPVVYEDEAPAPAAQPADGAKALAAPSPAGR